MANSFLFEQNEALDCVLEIFVEIAREHASANYAPRVSWHVIPIQ